MNLRHADIKGIRMSLLVIVVGVAMMVTAFGIKLASDVDRCHAGNEFRRRDLPAAFALFGEHLGAAGDADEADVTAFNEDFEADLAEVLPERDCGLLGL